MILPLPSQLNGASLCRFAHDFSVKCGTTLPGEIGIDFAPLRFIDPAGVTFLSNFIQWLHVKSVKCFFYNHDKPSQALQFLDDSLFFQSHLGIKNNLYSEPRSTTRPIQRVASDHSHSWIRTNLMPWLSTSININQASVHGFHVCVSEIFNNIKDHSTRDIGSVFAQHFPNKREITIAIADWRRHTCCCQVCATSAV